jgi:1,6-anhydro-N-acetylmuramate kinase
MHWSTVMMRFTRMHEFMPYSLFAGFIAVVQQDVDDLVVVGGASRMPWLRKALRAYFPRHTAMHMTDAAINAVRLISP